MAQELDGNRPHGCAIRFPINATTTGAGMAKPLANLERQFCEGAWIKMFELTMFELMLFLHILGAGAWLGANLTRALVGPYLTRAGNNTSAAWHRATVWIGRAVHTPAAITFPLGPMIVIASTAPTITTRMPTTTKGSVIS